MRALIALSLALALPATANDLFTVAHDGSGDYMTVKEAVQAVPSGSTVLVQPGSYSWGGAIDSKSLSLIADGGEVSCGLEVENLAPGQRVLIDGFKMFQFYATSNQGAIYIQDCKIGSAYSSYADITASEQVVFVDCELRGEDGDDSDGMPGNPGEGGWAALQLYGGSVVHLYDCVVQGGDGGYGDPPGYGGHGVYGWNSEVYIHQSDIAGGDGYSHGDDISMHGNSHVFKATHPVARLDASATLVREGEPLSLEITGTPGANVTLLIGAGVRREARWLGSDFGALHIASGSLARWEDLGVIPGSGTLLVDLEMGTLWNVDVRQYWIQLLVDEPGGAQYLGTPLGLTHVDSAF